MSVDGLVLTRQGVFGLIILVLVCGVPFLSAVRQGARVPSTVTSLFFYRSICDGRGGASYPNTAIGMPVTFRLKFRFITLPTTRPMLRSGGVTFRAYFLSGPGSLRAASDSPPPRSQGT